MLIYFLVRVMTLIITVIAKNEFYKYKQEEFSLSFTHVRLMTAAWGENVFWAAREF